MSCPGTGAPTRGWSPTSVQSVRRSLLEVTTCPNTSRCTGSHEATAPSAPWTDGSCFPLPAQPSHNSWWQHFAHYISSDNLFVSTEQSMLLLDTTMFECPTSFKDDLRMKLFLGQGSGVLGRFFFFLRILFSFPSICLSFAAASFGNYSVLFLAVFCCTGKCKSCLLLVNYSPGIPEGFAHVQATHCEFLLSCSICPVWKQQIPFEMKTTPLFLGRLSQGFVGAGHRRNSGSQG